MAKGGFRGMPGGMNQAAAQRIPYNKDSASRL